LSQSGNKRLGRLVAIHPISPAHLQRAVLLAILSFIFFLTMMFAYYLMQTPIYFLLATAFLVIYLATMYSFITGKKKTVEVFENGLRMGKTSAMWPDIARVDDKGGVDLTDGKKLEIPQSICERDSLLTLIRSHLK
jgi:Ca2+/Na+ antiporter